MREKELLDSAGGQPLGEQILGALGPPAGFVSKLEQEVRKFVVVASLGNSCEVVVPDVARCSPRLVSRLLTRLLSRLLSVDLAALLPAGDREAESVVDN